MTPNGPGASYLLYGLTPLATVSVRVSGEAEMTDLVEVSPYGAVFERLVGGLPRGTYRITVVDGETVLASTVVKTSGRAGPY